MADQNNQPQTGLTDEQVGFAAPPASGLTDEQVGFAPPPAAPQRSALGEIGTAAKVGLMEDLPHTAGKAMQWIGDQYSDGIRGWLYNKGQELSTDADQRSQLPENQLNPNAHGAVINTIAQGVRGAAQMVPGMAAGALLGGAAAAALPEEAAGGLAAGALGFAGQAATNDIPFAASQAEETREKALNAGKSESEANALGYKTGGLTAGTMALGGAVARGAMGAATPIIQKAVSAVPGLGAVANAMAEAPVENTAGGVISKAVNQDIAKPFLKNLAVQAPESAAVFAGQNYGVNKIEQNAGLQAEDPWKAAKEGMVQGALLPLMLSPLGLHAAYKNIDTAKQIDTTLSDPGVDAKDRMKTVNALYSAMPESVPNRDQWYDGALQDVMAGRPVRRDALNADSGDVTQGPAAEGQVSGQQPVAQNTSTGEDVPNFQAPPDTQESAKSPEQVERETYGLSFGESNLLNSLRKTGEMPETRKPDAQQALADSLTDKGLLTKDEDGNYKPVTPDLTKQAEQNAPIEDSLNSAHQELNNNDLMNEWADGSQNLQDQQDVRQRAANFQQLQSEPPAKRGADFTMRNPEDVSSAYSPELAKQLNTLSLPGPEEKHPLDAALDVMANQLRGGEVSRSFQNEQGDTSPTMSTYPDWFKQSTISDYNKKTGNNINLSKLTALNIIDKVREGKDLTPKQKDAWNYLEGVAQDLNQNHPDVVGGHEADNLRNEGFDFHSPIDIPVGDMRPGDQVVVDKNGIPDKFTHKGYDAQGNAILQDGQTLHVDPFERLNSVSEAQGAAHQASPEEHSGILDYASKIRKDATQEDLNNLAKTNDEYFKQHPYMEPYRSTIEDAMKERSDELASNAEGSQTQEGELSGPEKVQGTDKEEPVSGDKEGDESQSQPLSRPEDYSLDELSKVTVNLPPYKLADGTTTERPPMSAADALSDLEAERGLYQKIKECVG